jgi:TldD protein
MKLEQPIIKQAQHLDIATVALLGPSGLDTQAIQSVLSSIMSHQVDYADLYFQYSRSESWGLEEGQVKSGAFAIDQGVGVRAVSGEKTAFAYSDEINLPALQEAAIASKAIAAIGGNQTASKIITPEAQSLYLPNDPIASLSADAKVKLLERLEQFAKQQDPRITQVMASISGEYEVVAVNKAPLAVVVDLIIATSLTVYYKVMQKKQHIKPSSI